MRVAKQEIVADRAVHKRVALRHIHYVSPQPGTYFLLVRVIAVYGGFARARLHKSEQQPEQSRLAGTSRTYYTCHAPGPEIMAQELHHSPALLFRVAVAHIAQTKAGRATPVNVRSAEIFGRKRHYLIYPLQRHRSIHEGRHTVRQIHGRALYLPYKLQESRHHAERYRPCCQPVCAPEESKGISGHKAGRDSHIGVDRYISPHHKLVG